MKKYFVIAAGLLLAGCNWGWSESYWVHNTSDEKVTVNDTEVEPGACVKVEDSFTIGETEYSEEGHYQWDGSEAKKVSAEDVAVCGESEEGEKDGEEEGEKDGEETETPEEAADPVATANAAAEAAEAAAVEAERVANYTATTKTGEATRTEDCSQAATVLLTTISGLVDKILAEAQKAQSAVNQIHGIQQQHSEDEKVKAALDKAKAAYDRTLKAVDKATDAETQAKNWVPKTANNKCEES